MAGLPEKYMWDRLIAAIIGIQNPLRRDEGWAASPPLSKVVVLEMAINYITRLKKEITDLKATMNQQSGSSLNVWLS